VNGAWRWPRQATSWGERGPACAEGDVEHVHVSKRAHFSHSYIPTCASVYVCVPFRAHRAPRRLSLKSCAGAGHFGLESNVRPQGQQLRSRSSAEPQNLDFPVARRKRRARASEGRFPKRGPRKRRPTRSPAPAARAPRWSSPRAAPHRGERPGKRQPFSGRGLAWPGRPPPGRKGAPTCTAVGL